ncbi:UNVERIFIED_CONTAM: hypothetical protein HDU68_004819 [Siphonaria sp. JEL0065]|nr:hypothetical protein HDU68_004819 [Siphonaria sp. JEL0065]
MHPVHQALSQLSIKPALIDDDSDDVCLSATDSAFGQEEDQLGTNYTQTIPFEVLVQILSCVDSLSTLASVFLLSKRWTLAANDNAVWRNMFRRKFGSEKQIAQRLQQRGFFFDSASTASSVRNSQGVAFDSSAFKSQLELAKVKHEQQQIGDGSVNLSVASLSLSEISTKTPGSDPQVYYWDPLLDKHQVEGDTNDTETTTTTRPNYSNRIDPHISPRPSDHSTEMQKLLYASSMQISGSCGLTNGMGTWKSVFQQRLVLWRNWREGNYTVKSWTGHGDAVYCIQFQGDLLASGSRDRTLKFWDIDAVHCRRTLSGHEGSILCMQYDETYIVTGSSDSTTIVWDYQTGKKLYRLTGHTLPVLDIRFDSKRIITCSKDCSIKVWEISTGNLLHSFDAAHQAAVNAVHMSGDLAVSASGDCIVKLWNLNTGTLIRSFVGHTRGLACVQFDGTTILSGSNDNTIKIWDAMTGACIRTLEGHTNLVRTLCFDEERIVSGSYDNTIKVWDRVTGECLHTLAGVHNSWVFHVQMDASRIVSSAQDKRIAVWEFGRGCKLVKEFS